MISRWRVVILAAGIGLTRFEDAVGTEEL